jgi:hypothetical protein
VDSEADSGRLGEIVAVDLKTVEFAPDVGPVSLDDKSVSVTTIGTVLVVVKV